MRNSRALLLVDTSLSMGVADGEPSAAAAPVSRARASDRGAREDRFFGPAPPGSRRDGLSVQRRALPGPRDEFAQAGLGGRGRQYFSAPAAREAGGGDRSARLGQVACPHRHGNQARSGVAAVDSDRAGAPISGIVVLSDGGQNAGISPDAAVELAADAKIPVFTVGLGSDRLPTNMTVCDLAVPARAYPGDRYTVTGYVQAHGMAGRVATVQLLGRPASDAADAAQHGTGQLIESRQITLGGDGEVVPVKFELTPDAPGRRTLCFRIQPLPGDRNPADNLREADLEIVDRKNHVLLLAGGPSREYHFLRSQLYRDHSTTLDVLLQSGKPGISQEARKVLTDFPATREEMYDYDCVVAFDPNWLALSPAQVELLEKWVADQGGGLIVVAGAVYAGKGLGGWTENAAMTPIRNLYPVEFPSRLTSMENNMYASKEAVAAGVHPGRIGSRFSLAGRHGHGRASGLGRFSRRVRLLSGPRSEARGRRSSPASPIRVPPRAAGSRSILPGSSMGRGACFTSAAARCGGCGPWTRRISSSSIPS